MASQSTADNSQFATVLADPSALPDKTDGDAAKPFVDAKGRLWVTFAGGSGPGADVNATIVDPLPLPVEIVAPDPLPVDASGSAVSVSNTPDVHVTNNPTTLNGVSGVGLQGANLTHFQQATYANVVNAQLRTGAGHRVLRLRGMAPNATNVFLAVFDTVGATTGIPLLNIVCAPAVGGAFDVDLTSVGGLLFPTNGIYAALSTTQGSYVAAAALLWLEAWTI